MWLLDHLHNYYICRYTYSSGYIRSSMHSQTCFFTYNANAIVTFSGSILLSFQQSCIQSTNLVWSNYCCMYSAIVWSKGTVRPIMCTAPKHSVHAAFIAYGPGRKDLQCGPSKHAAYMCSYAIAFIACANNTT